MNVSETVDVTCPYCKKKICEANLEAEIKGKCPRCKKTFIHSASYGERLENSLTKK